MATLKNHPGKWLRDDAAAAFNQAEADHGTFIVNSAGRTVAEQNEAIKRWDQGGKWNRPPYLYAPARPATASNHVSNGGTAVDIGDWRRFANIAANYGFSHPYPDGDPVHFEFRGWGGSPPRRDEATLQRQTWLNSRGWNLVVDGIEGVATRQAYREYQAQLNRLGYNAGTVDGIWGNNTQTAHHAFYTAVHASSAKSVNDINYADIQAELNRHGYNLAVDNIWGTLSSNALAHFQSVNGLEVDRRVGPATWAKLTA